MLVQLSPWRITNTSIRAPKKSKRRKRDDENDLTDFPAVASFVAPVSRRVQNSMKQHSSEFSDSIPMLTLTSSHNVAVLGRSTDGIDELATLQYAGRPGNAGSFFPSPGDSRGSKNLPQIPAVLDAPNDTMFAMQLGNTRLCCWHAFNSTGPNDKNALQAELSQPAVSMSLLPALKGVVYGTCRDGTLFLGRAVVAGSDPHISVEYFQSKHSGTSRHIGTIAELPQTQSNTAGRKRKVSDADGLPVRISQVFVTDLGVDVVRHQLTCERTSSGGTIVIVGSHCEHLASVDLIPAQETKAKSLGRVQLLESREGTSPTVAIVYTTIEEGRSSSSRKTKELSETRCSLLCLSTGTVAHKPILLPSTSMQFGLISGSIVAVASSDTIALYDIETGGSLLTSAVMAEIHASAESWLLCTDAKFATVAILYSDGENIAALSSTLSGDDNHRIPQTEEPSLASKIASTVANSIRSVHVRSVSRVYNLLDMASPTGERATSQDNVRRALSSLEMALSGVLSHGLDLEEKELLQTYESAVTSIFSDARPGHMGKMVHHNPQDALPSNENGLKNGKKVQAGKAQQPKPANGVKSPVTSETLSSTPPLPQDFVDGSVRMIVSFLCSQSVEDSRPYSRKDALVILDRLIQTGKVSARLHFESQNAGTDKGNVLSTIFGHVGGGDEAGMPDYSCVDLIMNILQRCPDVSERQLVAMLNYMLRHSSAVDIATMFAESKNHPLKALSSKFIENRSKRRKLSDEEESGGNEEMSKRIITSGAAFVLDSILDYSECNEAMLRVALIEEFGAGREAVIVAKLLSDILKTPLGQSSLEGTAIKSVCQWVASLCDAFGDKLAETEAPSGENYLEGLVRSVGIASRQSQAIVSLLGDLNVAEQRKGADDRRARGQSTSEIPGYSLDRLEF